ncbi:hypothetical protein WAI453_005240 [Rhynchosporium graminicola]
MIGRYFIDLTPVLHLNPSLHARRTRTHTRIAEEKTCTNRTVLKLMSRDRPELQSPNWVGQALFARTSRFGRMKTSLRNSGRAESMQVWKQSGPEYLYLVHTLQRYSEQEEQG